MRNDLLIIYEIIIGCLILLSGFFSATETMLVSSGRFTIETLSKKNTARGRRAIYLLNNLEDAISAVLIGNNIVNITATAFITYIASHAFMLNENGIFFVTLGQVLVFLLFCEMLPKVAARANAERYLMFFSLPIKTIIVVFRPLNRLCLLFSSAVKKLFGIEQGGSGMFSSREELDLLFQIGEKDGIIEGEHHMYVSGILSFKDLTAHEVMTPTIDIASVELKSSVKELVGLIESTHYSRIPV
ncbi:MAG: CNNM domain-containing protein, partial [Spirochaetia bacterium]|nr:CNNM domain-containing protein [Spirochaetia bacterium]